MAAAEGRAKGAVVVTGYGEADHHGMIDAFLVVAIVFHPVLISASLNREAVDTPEPNFRSALARVPTSDHEQDAVAAGVPVDWPAIWSVRSVDRPRGAI